MYSVPRKISLPSLTGAAARWGFRRDGPRSGARPVRIKKGSRRAESRIKPGGLQTYGDNDCRMGRLP